MSGLPTPRREEPPSLAPEIAATVNAALADLERCAMEARVVEDRYGHWFDAQAHALRAFHRLFVDGVMTVSAALRDAQRPAALLSPDTEREMIDRVAKAVPPAVQRTMVSWHSWIDRKVALGVGAAGVALLVAGLASGFAAGWFWQADRVRGLQDTMSGLQASAFRDGPSGAQAWLFIESYNRIGDVMKCRVTVVSGRRRCDTSLWIDPEPQGKTQ